jgi:hypothetical protein
MLERPEVHFTTNATLDRLVEGFKKTPPDWDEVAHVFKNTKTYLLNTSTKDTIIGDLAEIHVDTVLKSLASSIGDIDLHPIPFYAEKNGIKFSALKFAHYQAMHLKHGTAVEYDQLMVVNDLPVVWEVKTSRVRNTHRKKSAFFAVQPERIDKVFTPLSIYFERNDFGYVVVAPEEVIDPSFYTVLNFQKKGGIMVPLYPNTDEYKSQLELVRFRHGLA